MQSRAGWLTILIAVTAILALAACTAAQTDVTPTREAPISEPTAAVLQQQATPPPSREVPGAVGAAPTASAVAAQATAQATPPPESSTLKVIRSPLLSASLTDVRGGGQFTLGDFVSNGAVVIVKPMAVW